MNHWSIIIRPTVTMKSETVGYLTLIPCLPDSLHLGRGSSKRQKNERKWLGLSIVVRNCIDQNTWLLFGQEASK